MAKLSNYVWNAFALTADLAGSLYNGANTRKNSSPNLGELQSVQEQADNARSISEDR